MADIWFDEDLTLPEESGFPVTKSPGVPDVPADYFAEAFRRSKMKVLADIPRFMELPGEAQQLRSSLASTFVLIRLGFQFLPNGDDISAALAFARCSARLERVEGHLPHPRVHDLYPRELFDGKPAMVSLAVSPKLEVGPLKLEGLTASTEITLGQVEPVIAGWAGEEERFPFWHIHPQGRAGTSVRHFWLTVELLSPARSLNISVLVEADVAGRFGPLRIGPRQRLWDQRPTHRIDLA